MREDGVARRLVRSLRQVVADTAAMFWNRKRGQGEGEAPVKGSEGPQASGEKGAKAKRAAPAKAGGKGGPPAGPSGSDFSALDFGALVGGGGSAMTGVCAIGDPRKVEACEWRVAKVQEKQTAPMFKILF
eukprot:evm.model.scf_192EXC.3 EVM.evm.TU.scf_192EXC.3   scf_192EXC:60496-60885(-)